MLKRKKKQKHGSWTEREDGTTMGHNRWRKNTQIPNKKWWALFANHNMYSNCKSGLFRKSSQSQSWYHLEVVLGVLQNHATNPNKPVWIVEEQCEATNYYHLDPKYLCHRSEKKNLDSFCLLYGKKYLNKMPQNNLHHLPTILFVKCFQLHFLPSDAPMLLHWSASPNPELSFWRYRHVDTLSIINVPEMENFIGYWFLSLKKHRGSWFVLEFFCVGWTHDSRPFLLGALFSFMGFMYDPESRDEVVKSLVFVLTNSTFFNIEKWWAPPQTTNGG